jgi:hypothetical protein
MALTPAISSPAVVKITLVTWLSMTTAPDRRNRSFRPTVRRLMSASWLRRSGGERRRTGPPTLRPPSPHIPGAARPATRPRNPGPNSAPKRAAASVRFQNGACSNKAIDVGSADGRFSHERPLLSGHSPQQPPTVTLDSPVCLSRL